MNKKTLIITVIILFLGLSIGVIGNSVNNSEDLQRLSRIEIYSSDGSLINAIEDKNILSQFNKIQGNDIPYEQEDEIKNTINNLSVLYTIISYKTPASHWNNGTLEKSMEITIYSDVDTIKEQVAPENIKGFHVPEEFMTFYVTISPEEKEFLLSLAELNNNEINN